MTVTFEPKGDVAEWQLVYDHIAKLKVGQLVTYDELSEILGRDFLAGRGPFHKANLHLLKTKKRGMLNVKNTGYRVVTAVEHETAAQSQHRSARRRLRRSKDWLTNTDRAELPPEAAARFDRLEESVARQIDFTRRLDGRLARVEKALAQSRQEVVEQTTETNETLAKLLTALERHGIKIDEA